MNLKQTIPKATTHRVSNPQERAYIAKGQRPNRPRTIKI